MKHQVIREPVIVEGAAVMRKYTTVSHIHTGKDHQVGKNIRKQETVLYSFVKHGLDFQNVTFNIRSSVPLHVLLYGISNIF